MDSARPASDHERELYERAELALQNAYAPHSGFRVGAVLLTTDGREFSGVNFENDSYGLTICAERSAAAAAIAAGVAKEADAGAGTLQEKPRCFAAIAVASSAKSAPPCGACRQVLAQFAADGMRVIYRRSGELESVELAELLPDQFEL